MSHEHTWSLAWTVEDLRFRVSYGLPADAHRLKILEETFEAEDPTHPLVLNRKAALALPEHFPAPDPSLSPAALAFRKGEYVAAAELLFPLAGRRVPGALAALGDVLLAVGRAEEAERRYQEARAKVMAELKRTFRPEFLNRVDDTIVFRRLTREDVTRIASVMTAALTRRMDSLG